MGKSLIADDLFSSDDVDLAPVPLTENIRLAHSRASAAGQKEIAEALEKVLKTIAPGSRDLAA